MISLSNLSTDIIIQSVDFKIIFQYWQSQYKITSLLFTFISLYNDSEDIRNAEVDNTADDSEAHGVEEQLRVGEDVLANVERVDLNDTLHHYHEDSVWILIIIKEPFIWFDFPNFTAQLLIATLVLYTITP